MEIRNCKYCNKQFFINKSVIKKGGGLYCSKKCFYKNNTGKNNCRYTKIEINCKICGKTILKKPSEMRNNKEAYCSKKCKNIGQSGENNKLFSKVKCICKNCGKKFKIKKSRLLKGRGKYCSEKCQHQGEITAININCAYCGKLFKIQQYRLKTGKHKFCSKNCCNKAFSEFEEYTGKNNHCWNGGKYKYYGAGWTFINKCILKHCQCHSELSGKLGKLDVHHIIPRRNFVDKYIDLCLKPYVEGINRVAFKILPYDLIPQLIYDEMNQSENLIALSPQEHKSFEGMPLGFFDAIKRNG